tara:strand:- start:1177 stop:1404 length:228 start_codon:yes stop_codon:yes gene_type:complete
MEHPLINDIGKLDEQQLHDKITELNGKLTIAMKMGNGSLINQVRMALESYNRKLTELYAEQRRKNEKFEDKIDIS